MFLSGCNKNETLQNKKPETGNTQSSFQEIKNDFKKYYDENGVEGTIVIYDRNKNKYFIYDSAKANKPFLPASTFKILNSLIGLETKVIEDENFVIKWDGVKRWNENWNKDHDLKTAYKNSTVWYYQELARRVDGDRMKHFLDTVGYGNKDTSGGIDQFWLAATLRITPFEQVEFLKRLHDNKLPFSQRSVDIVKKIMVAKDTLGYVVRAKTGWGFQDSTNIGWYVGYAETKDNVYYFANCIQLPLTADDKNFAKARLEIVYDVLHELKAIPE